MCVGLQVLNNEMTILRPLQVLAEEWLALRAKGIPTPSIAAWPTADCGGGNTHGPVCLGTKADGPQYAMWRWILDEFYNNPKFVVAFDDETCEPIALLLL